MFFGCTLPLLVLLGLVFVFLWQLFEHAGPQFANSRGTPERETLTPAERESVESRRDVEGRVSGSGGGSTTVVS
ncbi:hypothetical protein [Streptomyces sp. SPB4]|uniref:hypothetical protein n=1 Tax=Streptomyces TaxID=1883 RepID=UPI0024733585|nr:hypothetical protein [Streptomyces sp. SPB4]